MLLLTWVPSQKMFQIYVQIVFILCIYCEKYITFFFQKCLWIPIFKYLKRQNNWKLITNLIFLLCDISCHIGLSTVADYKVFENTDTCMSTTKFSFCRQCRTKATGEKQFKISVLFVCFLNKRGWDVKKYLFYINTNQYCLSF